MAARQEAARQTDEPVVSRTRIATGDESRVRANLTDVGKDIVGIEAGDKLDIRVFNDHIEVWPTGE